MNEEVSTHSLLNSHSKSRCWQFFTCGKFKRSVDDKMSLQFCVCVCVCVCVRARAFLRSTDLGIDTKRAHGMMLRNAVRSTDSFLLLVRLFGGELNL